MSGLYVYQDPKTGESHVVPFPSNDALLIARDLMSADHYGPLHIIVADGNIEDHHLDMCERELHKKRSMRGVGDLLIEALRKLPVLQRYAAWQYAAYGRLNPPGTE